ncbi:MAG TPA: dihydroorotase [Candidatus Cloacimonas sp.]|nr:dihydroorotase [Candidatus Cloacimonas sp.]
MPIERIYHDFHVHVGESIGGYRLRDDFADLNLLRRPEIASLGVALGSIGAFVTQEAGTPLKDKYLRMKRVANRDFSGKVFWHLSPLYSEVEDIIALLDKNVDLKLYTCYREAGLYSSYEQIERWMQALAEHKTRILIHCEDEATVQEYSQRHPFHHPHDHFLRRPEIAELRAVERVVDLAIKYSHPVHIVHVSTPQAAILIQEAKKAFGGISCETAPHYLLYNDDMLRGADAHRRICTPPFRAERSRGMLVELLQDGVFDILASDHCAFNDKDKDRFKDNPQKVPCGIAGIGELFASMHKNLVESGKISPDMLDRLTRINPARLMNLELQDEI